MAVSTLIVLDKRRQRKDLTYSVKLRLIYARKEKLFPINGEYLTEEDYQKTLLPNPRGEFKTLRLKFNSIEQHARNIIDSLPIFSFQAFEEKIKEKVEIAPIKAMVKDIYSMIDDYIMELKENNQLGTAESYKCLRSSLKNFIDDDRRVTLPIEFITVKFLNDYGKWMETNGKSSSTTGIYCRNLRCILNIAIEEGLMARKDYPFGKRRFTIPASRNIKKALDKSDLKKIFEYQAETEAEARYRDLWIFSYMCNGANIKDIAHLKYSNIDANTLSFVRHKTINSTKNDQQKIMVIIIPEMEEIIKKWGAPVKPNNFVFDIINEGESPEIRRANVRQKVKQINKYIRSICKTLEIEKEVTTYTARHSYATVMKRSGASIDMIGESLGQKNRTTTERYLDSFEDEVKREFHKKLVDF